jgi:ComF family protein
MGGQYIEPMPAPASTGTWPSLCAVCRGWGRQRVCADCIARFAPAVPRCRRCALRTPEGVEVCGACTLAPPPQASAATAFDYAAPWDRLITAFKFHQALDLAPFFVARLGAVPPVGHVLPVPLSRQRLRERGYNQAWELARRLAATHGTVADAALLLRVRDTPHQVDLPLPARASNVRDAFAIEPARRAEVRGAVFTLVDDVMTTGATLATAARVLLEAGAAEVHLRVLARTPRPHDA